MYTIYIKNRFVIAWSLSHQKEDNTFAPSLNISEGEEYISEILQKDESELPDSLGNIWRYQYNDINDTFIYDSTIPERVYLNYLRSIRENIFSVTDKYQLPYLFNSLSLEQQQEFIIWRQKWLDITITKIIPKNLNCFNEQDQLLLSSLIPQEIDECLIDLYSLEFEE